MQNDLINALPFIRHPIMQIWTVIDSAAVLIKKGKGENTRFYEMQHNL